MYAANRILIIGFGDIGERLAKYLRPLIQSRHLQVTALVRKPERAIIARTYGVVPIVGDLADRHLLLRIAGLAQIIFHFAPPPNHGLFDSHTRNLLAALSRQSSKQPWMLPQRLIYISTTGVYGDCGGAAIDETRHIQPATDRAKRRVDAEAALYAWGMQSGVAMSVLRAPGIYAKDRLPIERLKNHTPALIAADDVYTNHIHADDLARAAWIAAARGLPNRVYNVVDDTDLKMGDYFDLVADHYQLPRAPRLSREALNANTNAPLSPAMLSFMSESRRIGNARLKRELGFQFQYPSVTEFLMRIDRQ